MQKHFETIGSTNDTAKEWARDAASPAPHNAVVTADEQTHGRGRHGREWASPRDKGGYLSIIWRPQIAARCIGQLTIVTALGAARAIEAVSALPVETKWPNDLLVNRRKIGGILCEAEFKNGGTENDGVEFVIAGVGLNANFEAADFPERLIFPATSLMLEAGKTWSVEELRTVCADALRAEYSRYESGQWQTQRAEFISRCAIIGEQVAVRDGTREYTGVAVGVDEDGILIVQTATETRSILSGDVTFANS